MEFAAPGFPAETPSCVAAALVRRQSRGWSSDSVLPTFRIRYSSAGVPLTATAHNSPRPNPHILESAHE
jgi:hypothetical protein